MGKESYNLPIFHVNQAPEVAVAFVACCLGDLILEKGRMKIQALPLILLPPSPSQNPQPSFPRASAGSLNTAETQEK